MSFITSVISEKLESTFSHGWSPKKISLHTSHTYADSRTWVSILCIYESATFENLFFIMRICFWSSVNFIIHFVLVGSRSSTVFVCVCVCVCVYTCKGWGGMILSRICGDYIRRVLDWQLDLLDHTQLHTITVYTLYNFTVYYSTCRIFLQLQLSHNSCWVSSGPRTSCRPNWLLLAIN
jgi:hypothetical protein